MKDERIQKVLAHVMLGGVLLAAVILGTGLAWFLVTSGGSPPGDAKAIPSTSRSWCVPSANEAT